MLLLHVPGVTIPFAALVPPKPVKDGPLQKSHQNGTGDAYNRAENSEDAVFREDVDGFNADESRINTQI